MSKPNEVEVFYRGLAMLGILQCGGYTHDEVPELAKDLARRMMEDPPTRGIVAVKPRKPNRK